MIGRHQRQLFHDAIAMSANEGIAIFVADHFSDSGMASINNNRRALANAVARQVCEDFRMKRFTRILEPRFKRRSNK